MRGNQARLEATENESVATEDATDIHCHETNGRNKLVNQGRRSREPLSG